MYLHDKSGATCRTYCIYVRAVPYPHGASQCEHTSVVRTSTNARSRIEDPGMKNAVRSNSQREPTGTYWTGGYNHGRYPPAE